MIKLKFALLVSLLGVFSLTACEDDDDDIQTGEFTVTITNTFENRLYFNNGITGLIEPGNSVSYSFHAGQGHSLSFATMLVQSNDLFYAPSENGIALYDGNGNALTGDITGMVDLWDAGTEINEEPGTGPNQAPRQSGPDTGPEENGTVELISNVNDGFNYPADEDILQVTLDHDGGTMFTLTIENVSGNSILPSPLAPGVWVIHSGGQTPLFQEGTSASTGLERIAEDGNNTMINDNLSSNSGYVSPIAPGAWAINNPVFTTGTTASGALEALAEDGDPSGYPSVYNIPVGASAPGPILPGASYTFSFSAEEGDELSFASMLGQSNDWFLGARSIPLFSNGTPVSGEFTSMVSLYDAGTEVDEYAGAGNNQAPRQSGPDTGPAENGTVELEMQAGDHVPAVDNMIRVMISPN